ncbi:MAG: MATE family efflux transporter [Clostridia bacterium]|nr:MATE family efflux transporter [Clostridia bacterium]
MDETKKLGTEKLLKLLLKYSIPSIVGMLINAIYNIVDRIFIGQSPDLGSMGIGALTITFPIYIVIMGIALLFGNGGSILFSIHLGKQQDETAKKMLGISTSLIIISAFAITIIGIIFIDPVLKVFGAEGILFDYSKQYILIILLGSIFQCLALGLNNFIRADGHPKTSMITMLLGAIINIILDPIFIYVFKWGMAGAAIATIIGQFFSSLWVILHFTSKHCTYKLEHKYMKPDWKSFKLIFTYGLSAFIIEVAGSFVTIILNKSLVKYGGDIAISGMGIINSISTLLVLPVLGLVQGSQPIISYNYGAENNDRIMDTVKISMLIATLIMIACFIIANVFTYPLISIFNQESDLIDFTTYAIRIYFLAVPIVGMQIVGANYFQAVGKYKIAIILNLSRQILILGPLILLFSHFWQMDGILYACPLSDFLSFVITTALFIFEYFKFYRKKIT